MSCESAFIAIFAPPLPPPCVIEIIDWNDDTRAPMLLSRIMRSLAATQAVALLLRYRHQFQPANNAPVSTRLILDADLVAQPVCYDCGLDRQLDAIFEKDASLTLSNWLSAARTEKEVRIM